MVTGEEQNSYYINLIMMKPRRRRLNGNSLASYKGHCGFVSADYHAVWVMNFENRNPAYPTSFSSTSGRSAIIAKSHLDAEIQCHQTSLPFQQPERPNGYLSWG